MTATFLAELFGLKGVLFAVRILLPRESHSECGRNHEENASSSVPDWGLRVPF